MNCVQLIHVRTSNSGLELDEEAALKARVTHNRNRTNTAEQRKKAVRTFKRCQIASYKMFVFERNFEYASLKFSYVSKQMREIILGKNYQSKDEKFSRKFVVYLMKFGKVPMFTRRNITSKEGATG